MKSTTDVAIPGQAINGLGTMLFFIFLWMGCNTVMAQQDTAKRVNELKQLSLEDLMNIDVTLVSRTPESILAAPSAIQVISGADIARSGALNIPEALRLLSNLQVAQLNSNAWIISSRGFNTVFANKLLVMIDGRTVYTPLFGGVIWELQNVLLEDVERIEVVSGPGATLWGANAVNGVINIVTKKSSESQGLYIAAAVGTFLKDFGAVRYGGKMNDRLSYKIYGQHFDHNATLLPNGEDNTDKWRNTRAGFRMDLEASATDSYTLQGDFFTGTKKTAGGNSDFNGQNILGRWSHIMGEKSDVSIQVYFDRYFTDDIPGNVSDRLITLDLDFQHRLPVSAKQQLIWGGGYRSVKDENLYKTTAAGILPANKNLDLISFFIQDEITLHKKLKFTGGSKVLHNVYTGIEIQPSLRLAWLNERSTLWGSVSRAVRTPSRLDVDYYLPAVPVTPDRLSIAGGPNFVSEKLLACELGWRVHPGGSSSLSVSTFYNLYDDLYSVEMLPGTLTYQIQNGSEGESWGVEIAGSFRPTNIWKVRGGYTYFDKDLRSKPGHNFDPSYLGNDVKHQVVLHSLLDLSHHIQLDIFCRFLSRLDKTLVTERVPAYGSLDARIAYNMRGIELSLVGQNLTASSHQEFNLLKIPRNIYVKAVCRF